MRLLLAAAALLAFATTAVAQPVGIGPLDDPLCGIAASGPACWRPYASLDPDRIGPAPGTVCPLDRLGGRACELSATVSMSCTLDLPPSRCGNHWLAFGFG